MYPIKLLTILYLVPVVLLFAAQKIVYQKDVSEYCRRRVLPSIFLARNAIESTSVILHFSRVELPYSCAISVRTESGCNIIMVSKFNPRTGLADSCAVNSPELVVHEMGETFGGYWGQLSETVIKSQEQQPKQFYTLKTTQSISTRETVVNITMPTSFKTPTESPTIKKKKPEDESSEEDDGIMKVEVPIVNVYGKFVQDPKNMNQPTEDSDAMFDLRYDVTPEPGKVYDTSMMPLVQFAVKKLVPVGVDGRREEESDEPRFDLDIVEQFTPDKRKSQSTQFKSYLRDYSFPTTKTHTSKSVLVHWKTIEELMNKLNNTSPQEENIKTLMKDATLDKISDMRHNASIYLKPNLKAYLHSVGITTFTPKKKLQFAQFKSYMRDYIFPTTKANTSKTVSTHWKTIEDLMHKLNHTSIQEKNANTLMKDATLEKISNMQHNDSSMYLQ